MQVGALAVRHVVPPLAHVDVPLAVHEPPPAVRLVLLPLALINRAVGPRLHPEAAAILPEPLTVVDGLGVELVAPPLPAVGTSGIGQGRYLCLLSAEVADPIGVCRKGRHRVMADAFG